MSLQSARGTHDLLFEDFKTQSLIIEKAQAVCECYGYEGISTPVFEFTDIFKRTLGETSDIVHKQNVHISRQQWRSPHADLARGNCSRLYIQ